MSLGGNCQGFTCHKAVHSQGTEIKISMEAASLQATGVVQSASSRAVFFLAVESEETQINVEMLGDPPNKETQINVASGAQQGRIKVFKTIFLLIMNRKTGSVFNPITRYI